MAFALLEDLTGTVEVIIFTDLYEKNRELLIEDRPVLIKGKTDIKIEDDNKKEVKIIGEEITPLPLDSRQLFIKIDMNEDDLPRLIELRNMLFNQNGEVPVYLLFEEVNKTMILSEKYWAKNEQDYFEKIEELLGNDSVLIKEVTAR